MVQLGWAERFLAVLAAEPTGELAAVPAVPGWERVRRKGPPCQGEGLMRTRGLLELLLGLELLPGQQSAAHVLSLLRDGRSLLARAVMPHQPH